MNGHVKNRLIDVVTVVAVALVFWAIYTGYVLIGAVNSFYTNQCGVIQDQALEQAVERELAKRAIEEEGVKE